MSTSWFLFLVTWLSEEENPQGEWSLGSSQEEATMETCRTWTALPSLCLSLDFIVYYTFLLPLLSSFLAQGGASEE